MSKQLKRKHFIRFFMALAAVSVTGVVIGKPAASEAAPVVKQFPLTQQCILKAINTATDKARELGRAGSFILVDTHGEILASYRMKGALPSTFGFAKSKAVTSVALGIPTDKMATSLPRNILNNLMTSEGGKFVVFPGGYPVRVNGKIAAGVAFGSTIVALDSNVAEPSTPNKDADVVCAKAALNVLESCQPAPVIALEDPEKAS